MQNELRTIYHVIFGLLAVSAAVWTAVEVINISEANRKRARLVSLLVTLFSCMAFILGGYEYVRFYDANKAIVQSGPWPWAQNIIMEVKEHSFLLLLLLSIYLPITVFHGKILESRKIRKLAVTSAVMLAVIGLGMQVFGTIVDRAVKMGLIGVK